MSDATRIPVRLTDHELKIIGAEFREDVEAGLSGKNQQPRLRPAIEEIITARMADAWDEGYLRGVLDQESELEPADNPYRRPGAAPDFMKWTPGAAPSKFTGTTE